MRNNMFCRTSYKVFALTLILFSFFVLHLIHRNHLPLESPSCASNLSGSTSTLVTGSGTTTHGKYVSLCRARLTGNHRTGNHLFMLAAMLHVARVTGRTLVMPRTGWYLDQIFQLNITRYDDVEKQICPCQKLDLPHYDYDQRFDDPKFVESLSCTNKSLLLCGLSQTYRYAEQNEYELRRLLRFPENLSDMAVRYLSILPLSLTRIGVHVRRGDFLKNTELAFGLTIADASYFHSAFRYFTNRYNLVNFVVATEDRNWTVTNLPESTSKAWINLTDGETAAFDLAVLSMCDGVIMSTGSFGWWAAWIAKKTSVFYQEWPRNGSKFYFTFNRGNYFPSYWVPLK